MTQTKKYIYLILALFLIAVIGSIYFLSSRSSQYPKPLPDNSIPVAGPIVIQGLMVCLPHKDMGGPQTLECAFGLKDDLGRYFALKDTDPGYKNIGGVPTNIRVEVQGTFSPRTDSNYQDIGIINVVRITRLATSNPTDGVAESWGSIFGTVLLGPNCPVIREPPDPECADKPYETSLVVTTADGARVIKEFNSDSNGKFNVDLPPGEYAIRSAAIANIRPHCSSNGTVRVKSNDSTEIVISCDTGIR